MQGPFDIWFMRGFLDSALVPFPQTLFEKRLLDFDAKLFGYMFDAGICGYGFGVVPSLCFAKLLLDFDARLFRYLFFAVIWVYRCHAVSLHSFGETAAWHWRRAFGKSARCRVLEILFCYRSPILFWRNGCLALMQDLFDTCLMWTSWICILCRSNVFCWRNSCLTLLEGFLDIYLMVAFQIWFWCRSTHTGSEPGWFCFIFAAKQSINVVPHDRSSRQKLQPKGERVHGTGATVRDGYNHRSESQSPQKSLTKRNAGSEPGKLGFHVAISLTKRSDCVATALRSSQVQRESVAHPAAVLCFFTTVRI